MLNNVTPERNAPPVSTEPKENLGQTLQLQQLQLKNFRCFSGIQLQIEGNTVLLEGANGSGKTSILEALHYICYLRSFRTHLPQELIHAGESSFFIKASFLNTQNAMPLTFNTQVGFQHKRRLVKIDDRPVNSYKDVLSHYRVVTLTEEDIALISGGPEMRRTFLDQALLLHDATFLSQIKRLRVILDQRNALLRDQRHSTESYHIWTRQLWEHSAIIQEQRKIILEALEKEIHDIGNTFPELGIQIACRYRPKLIEKSSNLADFLAENPDLHGKEKLWARSLFGAHLDDIAIDFQERRSKAFASRGQQKLIALILKVALIKILNQKEGPKAVFLLDDFMTDFDDKRIEQLLDLLNSLGNQLIFTCPLRSTPLTHQLIGQGAHRIQLTT